MFRRIQSYYQTAIADIRFQGFEVLLWRTVVKVFSPIVKLDYQILFELDLTQPIEARQSRVECEIKPATEIDLDDILDMQLKLPPVDAQSELSDAEEIEQVRLARVRANARETFLQALQAGEMCFVARVGGEVAHSNWTRFHDCAPVDSRPVDLLPGEIYTTDGFTDERWRGMRLHEAVLSHMLRFAQRRGCHRAYTITDMTKAASRRGLRRVGGWTRRGKILYISPRGLGRTWLVRLGGDIEPMFRHARASMVTR